MTEFLDELVAERSSRETAIPALPVATSRLALTARRGYSPHARQLGESRRRPHAPRLPDELMQPAGEQLDTRVARAVLPLSSAHPQSRATWSGRPRRRPLRPSHRRGARPVRWDSRPPGAGIHALPAIQETTRQGARSQVVLAHHVCIAQSGDHHGKRGATKCRGNQSPETLGRGQEGGPNDLAKDVAFRRGRCRLRD